MLHGVHPGDRSQRKISGVFNIASGNYTVGEVADLIKSAIEERLTFR